MNIKQVKTVNLTNNPHLFSRESEAQNKDSKMASKGDFVLVEDPSLPMGWTKKVFAHFFCFTLFVCSEMLFCRCTR